MVRVVIIEEAHHHLAHEFREKLLLQVERPERLQGQLDRGRLIRVYLDHMHSNVNYWEYPNNNNYNTKRNKNNEPEGTGWDPTVIEGCTLMLFRSLVVRLPGWVKGLPASTIESWSMSFSWITGSMDGMWIASSVRASVSVGFSPPENIRSAQQRTKNEQRTKQVEMR